MQAAKLLPRVMNQAAMFAGIFDYGDSPYQSFTGFSGRGSEAGINTPSTLGDNWKWRMKQGDLQRNLRRRYGT